MRVDTSASNDPDSTIVSHAWNFSLDERDGYHRAQRLHHCGPFGAGDRVEAGPLAVAGTEVAVASWFRWTANRSLHCSGIHDGDGSWELRVTQGVKPTRTVRRGTTPTLTPKLSAVFSTQSRSPLSGQSSYDWGIPVRMGLG